jgi:hypothetical protein
MGGAEFRRSSARFDPKVGEGPSGFRLPRGRTAAPWDGLKTAAGAVGTPETVAGRAVARLARLRRPAAAHVGSCVVNLAHSASFHSREQSAPLMPEIKHLERVPAG